MNTTESFLSNIENIGATDKEKLEMLSVAVNAWNNCVIITDPGRDHQVIYANTGFERLTGYDREEIIGRNCRFLQNDDREQAGLLHIREALRTGSECTTILRNYRKDGELFYNELYLAPVHSADGELSFYVGVQNDITQRVKHEQNLRSAIQDSLQDSAWLTQAILDRLSNIRAGRVIKEMPKFTAREREVLTRLAKGHANRRIAEDLGLSVNTVRNYVNNLYGKLNVNSRSEAIIWARERGIN